MILYFYNAFFIPENSNISLKKGVFKDILIDYNELAWSDPVTGNLETDL